MPPICVSDNNNSGKDLLQTQAGEDKATQPVQPVCKSKNRKSFIFPIQTRRCSTGVCAECNLFSVAIDSVINEISNPVRASLFVDDLAIYCTAYVAESACKYLQKSNDSISRWAKQNGFRFSTRKTVAVRFTRSRRQEVVPNLKLDGSVLPYADDVKFLGMIFYSKLTWSKHIENLKCKVKKSLNLLKLVCGFNWDADKKTLLQLYDALCRLKLNYGCQIYSSACKSKLHELDVIQNMGLRICSGAFPTSPVECLHVDYAPPST
ncbi:uncharacterized protein LOC135218062 [Macrobrachium nipponense]|uniref:uncharacterized protein LOC135218062 n=1 Tax=Macrobrachium nipponense TaxID=159736 RepID=UPI0030C7CFC3